MPDRLPRPDPLRVDLALSALLAGISAIVIATATRSSVRSPDVVVLALLVCGAVAVRRRRPLAACSMVAAAILVGVTAFSSQLQHVGTAQFAFVLVGYSAGAHAGRREGWICLALLLAAMTAIYVDVAGRSAPSEFLWELALAAGPFTIGRLVRARRALHAELEDRALGLAHERDRRERLAVAAERARIARELHDVVAHSLSVMIVQAGAGGRILQRDPTGARQALAAIAETGHQAKREMGRLLGFLQDDTAGRPGLDQVGELVEQARAAGLPVNVEVRGVARRLPAEIELSAYRIVQEGLTNALKHAAGAPTRVLLVYGAGDVRVAIADEGRGTMRHGLGHAGGGHGLDGMRERVSEAGGELRAGRLPGGGWELRARLPVTGAGA